jgi:hypothetical protein
MATRHYWDGPTIPPTAPSGGSITLRTRCGISRTLPIWQAREWAATADTTPRPAEDCTECVAGVTA